MPIVSVSLRDEMIEEMNDLQKSGGFAGRSELVRASLRMLVKDSREKSALSGRIFAIMLATHAEADEAPITKLKHQFDEIVKTHIHKKVSEKCVEIFLLEGDGKKIGQMALEFQKEDKVASSRLLLFD